jgi:2-isopropylmalate synthase
MEAGFPIASEGDFEAVKAVSQVVEDPNVTIAGLSRVVLKDIDRAWEALQHAPKGRIHTFIATSPIHMEHKLKMTPQQVVEAAVAGVRHARQYTDDVEFSPEDAGRTEIDFLCEVITAVIDAGATTINIPDTVGYTIPEEFGARIATIRERVPNINEAVISVHCHNDLGLAVANSLAAIQNGARQVECTINGIGERAGNASLEEIVMALKVRQDFLDHYTNICSEEIYRTSQLLTAITGVTVQPNKAIVGKNAFAHEAGIHQHGVIMEAATYEIMTPQSIGKTKSDLVLGKHSGRHALRKRLEELGYKLEDAGLDAAFVAFKRLADRKKEVFDEDLVALMRDQTLPVPETFRLVYLHTISGSETLPTATIRLSRGEEVFQDAAIGDGPVDATYQAIDRITNVPGKLLSYAIRAVTGGKDAQGEVVVKVSFNGETVTGIGHSTDIIEASAKAYINAVNKVMYWQRKPTGEVEEPRATP